MFFSYSIFIFSFFYLLLLIFIYFIYFKFTFTEKKIIHFASFFYDVGNVAEWRNVGRNDVRWTGI